LRQRRRATNSYNVVLPQPIRGCHVIQRYIAQVSRGRSKEVVFAEILSGFLLAADPKVVAPNPRLLALNLVMAEDWCIPMRDFGLHMRILDYFH
jgi:adenosine deaminase